MPNFEGHNLRECGEHRTVGPHRAWCFDCTEWCYPDDGCKGCRLANMAPEVLHRIKWFLRHHTEDGPAGVYWGCAAHSEGQWCCIDALTDDAAWQHISAGVED